MTCNGAVVPSYLRFVMPDPTRADAPDDAIRFDADFIARYDKPGPRYTSYPTAVQFTDDFGPDDWARAAQTSNASGGPLSLYLHIPFCHSLCYYCGCTKVVTRHPERADTYLEQLYREIALQGALFDDGRPVDQIHLGGGTPTFLSDEQLAALLDELARHFDVDPARPHEFSIEIDPRTADAATLDVLAGHGFNRLSLGVQDFDARVQEAVNRLQPAADTLALIDHGRRAGFESVSIDLIYGLPFQTVASFDATLDTVLDSRPDRIAAYSYAHLPRMFRAQKLIRAEDLPSPSEKLAILGHTVERLTAAGYVYIGMDHFALPDDELVVAQRSSQLHRNFQGYSTHADCELVGLGASAIGFAGGRYGQNARLLRDYYASLRDGRLALARGLRMTDEDRLRWGIIQQIMCHNRLDYERVAVPGGVDFHTHFARELAALAELADDGLLALRPDGFTVTPRGRFLVRVVAAVFDQYLAARQDQARFSKVI